MITLQEFAYAKINLTLDVLGKREDGYHDLSSIMQTVSIRDDIEIDIGTGKPWKLLCDKDNIPADENNLAWKAAKVFFDAVKKDPDGLEIRIIKRIPSEAGLGGGSADAAAVLRALNRHYDAPFSILALAELGAGIGCDVPFCVLGGTAMVEGRGERPLRGMLSSPVDLQHDRFVRKIVHGNFPDMQIRPLRHAGNGIDRAREYLLPKGQAGIVVHQTHADRQARPCTQTDRCGIKALIKVQVGFSVFSCGDIFFTGTQLVIKLVRLMALQTALHAVVPASDALDACGVLRVKRSVGHGADVQQIASSPRHDPVDSGKHVPIRIENRIPAISPAQRVDGIAGFGHGRVSAVFRIGRLLALGRGEIARVKAAVVDENARLQRAYIFVDRRIVNLRRNVPEKRVYFSVICQQLRNLRQQIFAVRAKVGMIPVHRPPLMA